MRAFLHVIAVSVAAVLASASVHAAATGPSLLFDPATGEVVSQDRAGEPWYPASLTKLMTAYLVFKKIERGELRLDQKIPVSVFADAQQPSKIGIKPGGSVTADFALQAMLVYSANDVAVALAEAAGGTVHQFVQEMNRTAALLGMSGTHFTNPNGLFDPRQVSTARDMGVLAAAILAEFPEHAHYFSQDYVEVGKRKLLNRNSLIRQMPESDGMKTGFVCSSGFNLVASATRGGRRMIAVVLGSATPQGRADLAQMLLTDGFARTMPEGRLRLVQIANEPLGNIVPTDMTATVCRRKAPVAMASAKDLGGWGVSFGGYETAAQADMALRGRLLDPAGLDAAGDAGVVRVPGKAPYAAMLWNLDQPMALSLCNHYHRQNAPCEVMTPPTFAQIAALAVESAVKPQKPVAQGSDAGGIKKKKKKKKTRAK